MALKDLMSILEEDFSVQRFQAGGLPIPITPVPTNPDANRPVELTKAQSY